MPRSLRNLTVMFGVLPSPFRSFSLVLGQHTFSKWPGRCLVSQAPGSERHSCLRPWGHVQGALLSSVQTRGFYREPPSFGRGWEGLAAVITVQEQDQLFDKVKKHTARCNIISY